MKMKSMVLASSTLLLAVGFLAAPATADSPAVDSDHLKSIWHELTPEERATYDRLMSEQAKPAPAATGSVARFGPSIADTCTAPAAGSIALPFMDTNDTTGVGDDYDLDSAGTNGDCGSGQFTFTGTGAAPEIAYSLEVDQDCTLLVDAAPGTHDLALYVVENTCTALPGFVNAECIALDDNGGAGTAEEVTIDAVAGNVYFVIVDGFDPDGFGPYDLTISETTSSGCSLVPVELQSFSVN